MDRLSPFILTLIRKTKRLFVKALLFSMLASLLNGFSVMMLIPLMSLIGLQTPSIGFMPSSLMTFWGTLTQDTKLAFILAVFVVATLMGALADQQAQLTTHKVAQRFTAILKNDLNQAVIEAPYETITRLSKQDLMHLFTTEVTRLSNAGLTAIRLVTNVMALLIMIGFSLSVSWPFTLLVLGGAAALALILFPVIAKLKKLGYSNLKVLRQLNTDLHDQLYGYKDIKNTGYETIAMARFRALSEDIVTQFVQFFKNQTQVDLLYRAGAAILVALFAFIAIEVLGMSVASMAVLVVLFSRLWPLTTALQKSFQELILLIPSFTLYQETLSDFSQREQLEDRHTDPKPLTQALRLTDAQFAYHANQSFGIALSCTIPAHQITVIVGSSGSGKTTLADVLCGLLPLKSGTLTIDDVPVATYGLSSYRRHFAVVEAESYLIRASIRANLTQYAPLVGDDILWECLKKAQLETLVKNLPQGLDTLVGDDGILLSSGERQRLLLARALVRNPSILVLDEATNALDGANDQRFLDVLVSLKKEKTILMIAHRESAMRLADQILVMEEGHLVESGPYRTLKADPNSKLNRVLGQR